MVSNLFFTDWLKGSLQSGRKRDRSTIWRPRWGPWLRQMSLEHHREGRRLDGTSITSLDYLKWLTAEQHGAAPQLQTLVGCQSLSPSFKKTKRDSQWSNLCSVLWILNLFHLITVWSLWVQVKKAAWRQTGRWPYGRVDQGLSYSSPVVVQYSQQSVATSRWYPCHLWTKPKESLHRALWILFFAHLPKPHFATPRAQGVLRQKQKCLSVSKCVLPDITVDLRKKIFFMSSVLSNFSTNPSIFFSGISTPLQRQSENGGMKHWCVGPNHVEFKAEVATLNIHIHFQYCPTDFNFFS